MQARVRKPARQAAEEAANALGVSLSAYMEALLLWDAQHRDEGGRPRWWTEATPPEQEVLPLEQSA